MKTLVTLTVGLMILSATFAQSSRRTETKENNAPSAKKSETVNSERRSPSDRTTEVSSTRRGSESTSTEKKAEVSTTEQNTQDRTSATNRRNASGNSTSEKRTEVSSTPQVNKTTQDRSSVTNRRNPSVQTSQPSVNSRTTDNRRIEPVQNNTQVNVQQNTKRTVERHHKVVHKSYRPVPVEVRRVKYPYRAPVRSEVIWTVDLSRRYEVYYPAYRPYRYHVGMRLATISAYDSYDFVGEIARVYGRVAETYYSWETDEYFLYVGDYYPYQDFTVVIPGREASDFGRRPERFFDREYIEVTGLITRFEGKPEMVIKRSSQINVY